MSNCPDCLIASKDIHTGHFGGECMDCQARAIAQSPAAHSRHADPSVLQAQMRRVWVDHDEYKRGRALVWHWLLKLEALEKSNAK